MVASSDYANGIIVSNGTQVSTELEIVEDFVEFYLWLEVSDVLQIQPYTIDFNNGNGEPITRNYIGSTYLTKDPVHNGVVLTFDCKRSERFQVYVSIGVSWHYPIGSQFYKVCRTGGGGWSPGGIAVFVLFLIGVGICMAGCCYNYIQLGKSGVDVVPGSSYYRRCYAWLVEPKRVGPQTDDTGKGYGTYQNL